MTKKDYIQYLDEINDLYMEDYRGHTGRQRGNISCIYASETHAKGTDNKPSMGYMKNIRKYHCNTCNKMAGLIDLVKADNNYTSDSQAIEYLQGIYPNIEKFKKDTAGKNDIVPTPVQPVKEIPNVEINTDYDFTDLIDKANELVLANDKHDSLSMYGYKYFTERGINEDSIKRFKLGVVNDINDMLVNYDNIKVYGKTNLYKIILPMVDEQGTCNNFIAEICNRKEIDEHNQKYRKLTTTTGLTTQLFNEYHLKHNRPITIFIVEGIYDAISVEQMGFNAVALIGIGATRLENLLKYYKPNANLVIMLDNDEQGKKSTKSILDMLHSLNMENIKYIDSMDILENYKNIATCKDANDMLLKDSKALKEFLVKNYKIINANEDTDRIDNANLSNLLDYFKTIESQPPAKLISTGFTELDKNFYGGLRTGFYVLGALSNLGKTAFMLQLADQIAKQGIPVLYFSLEMDKKELMARSISRTTFIQVGDKIDKKGYPIASTTFDILDNIRYQYYDKDKKDTIYASIDIYDNIAKNMYIVSGRYKEKDTSRRMTINDIEKIIKDFLQYKGITPIIFIDYMQIIAPVDPHFTDKQNMDEVVTILKQISVEVDTPVLAISSYNRDNYYEPANVSAFKESGAIDYGADYILALQYKGIDEIYYENSKSKGEQQKKREIYELIENLKLKSNQGEPIPIVIKKLKGRNSGSFNMVFNFKARYGYFKEDTYKADTKKAKKVASPLN